MLTTPPPVDLAAPRPARVRVRVGVGAAGAAGIGPNWFASVMGTGILAVVLAPHAAPVALALWLVAASLLLLLAVVMVRQDRSYVEDPVQRHFYGAPAMALMTVGSGAIATLGPTAPVLGRPAPSGWPGRRWASSRRSACHGPRRARRWAASGRGG